MPRKESNGEAHGGDSETRLAWFEENVSTLGFKEWARKYLPLTSRARGLIMEMSDAMPRWIMVGQFEIISKIVEDELKTL
jgi:hypothetical protein